VFYGEYDSRIAASNAKDSLPEVLRKASPISRSLGGIIREIRRLEAMS
jgi:septal ring-binding cell division protein DamX